MHSWSQVGSSVSCMTLVLTLDFGLPGISQTAYGSECPERSALGKPWAAESVKRIGRLPTGGHRLLPALAASVLPLSAPVRAERGAAEEVFRPTLGFQLGRSILASTVGTTTGYVIGRNGGASSTSESPDVRLRLVWFVRGDNSCDMCFTSLIRVSVSKDLWCCNAGGASHSWNCSDACLARSSSVWRPPTTSRAGCTGSEACLMVQDLFRLAVIRGVSGGAGGGHWALEHSVTLSFKASERTWPVPGKQASRAFW
mmetsp:Transcript_33427/g.73122  ORF Transcript_33427/g.73122 Transcript_33427/m.73122 type:complete len:256 (-) Transcript_33427:1076-1843(-)